MTPPILAAAFQTKSNEHAEAIAMAEFFRRSLNSVPGHEDLDTRFDWKSARRVSQGIQIPGTNGRYDLLVQNGISIKGNIQVNMPDAYVSYKHKLIVCKMPTLEMHEESLAIIRSYLSSSPEGREGFLYAFKEQNTLRDAKVMWKALLIHEIKGHADNAPGLVYSKHNNESAAYTAQVDYAVTQGLSKPRSPDQIFGFIVGGYNPQTYALELLARTNGKLDADTRRWLPGGESFNAALSARLARVNDEIKTAKGEKREMFLASAKTLLKSLNDPAPYWEALAGEVSVQLFREYENLQRDAQRSMKIIMNPQELFEKLKAGDFLKGSQQMQERVAEPYLNQRYREFFEYLNSGKETFSLTNFVPYRR